jgi:hypothetical protein
MATGTGKTTVMGMLAAWSILNKVNNRGDARFSDVCGGLPQSHDQTPPPGADPRRRCQPLSHP